MDKEKKSFTFYSLEDIKFLKKYIWYILIGSSLGGVLGYMYSFLLPVEYNANASVLPELQSKSSLGGFRDLAELAGISLDNVQVTEAIRPDLYPSVLESKPFLLKVTSLKIYTNTNRNPETVQSYLQKQSAPIDVVNNVLFGWMNKEKDNNQNLSINRSELNLSSDILIVNKDQENMLKNLASRIKVVLDKRTGIIRIDVTMPDPIAAAMITQYAMDYLNNYMLEYRLGKQVDQRDFLAVQRKKAKERFEKADESLRAYRDRNRNPFLSSSTSDESKLQSELAVAQSIYSELSRQTEQAQIKSREEMPVLKVLDPPQVPLKRSSPKRAKISLYGLIIGIIVSSGLSYIYKYRRAI